MIPSLRSIKWHDGAVAFLHDRLYMPIIHITHHGVECCKIKAYVITYIEKDKIELNESITISVENPCYFAKYDAAALVIKQKLSSYYQETSERYKEEIASVQVREEILLKEFSKLKDNYLYHMGRLNIKWVEIYPKE